MLPWNLFFGLIFTELMHGDRIWGKDARPSKPYCFLELVFVYIWRNRVKCSCF